MKTVLITGADSYIGTSFEEYAEQHYKDGLNINTIDLLDSSWRKKPFKDFNGRSYDVVFHVAGIAHADVGNVSEKMKRRYYDVNTDLAIECAKKAKEDGVGQFVFMSSMIIYGDSAPYGKQKKITKTTNPSPSNFYGDSKWKADKGVRKLASESFTVTVLRPPMIYGKGSKGNFPMLSKMARKLPVFPDARNERSLLYIGNLCEFLCQIMLRGCGGVYWPQNAEYTSTTELVRCIGEVSGHRIVVTGILNWAVGIASLVPGKIGGMTNKAFGNFTYEHSMSTYSFDYQIYDLRTSIERSER